MKKASILVTGGAGYIGSHIVKQLAAANENVVVLDNLSTGYAENVIAGKLIIGDCGDQKLVAQILRDYHVDTVIHLAASIIVSESTQLPLKYTQNNLVNTQRLLECCDEYKLPYFIFSSSASVYGNSNKPLVNETDFCQPINPYGRSKLVAEWMLEDLSAVTNLRYVALRYFNVGGADLDGNLGLRNPKATTLIKIAAQTALGLRSHIDIYGTDYPTFDGTGIRDYVHVEDIASAHLAALEYLRKGNSSQILNCGYGKGYSVRQVLDSVQRLANVRLNIRECPRRAGDPAEIVADNRKILSLLNWQPQFADLDIIVKSSLAWEKKLLDSLS